MSYILDALKRADAERERGHVPGLHSQSPATFTSAPASPHSQRPGVALMAGAVLLLLLAAAGWWWLTAPGADIPQPSAVMAPAAAPRPAPLLLPASPTATAAATLPTAPAQPILAPEPATSPRNASEPAPPRQIAPTPSSVSPGKETPKAASTPEPTAPAASPAGSPSTVRSFAELPPEIRAQLPPISISGSTYSSNPAHRMLIANGKVVHEGDEIAPGLQLDSIGPGKAVLNHRGTRYSIGY